MKHVHTLTATLVLTAMAGLVHGLAQSSDGKPDVIKLDPALDAVISSDAKLEKVKSGFGFTEGTNWVQHGKEGYLLFSDIPANKIFKMLPDGTTSVFVDRSGYTGVFDGFTMWTAGGGTVNGQFIMLGTDGLTIDREGRVIACAFGDKALVRFEKDGSKRTVLADKYEGKGLNGPNDAVVKKDGTIYFSDTFSGLRFEDNDRSKPKQLDPNRLQNMVIFMLKDGKLTLVVNDLPSTNGLAFTPDEKFLYINSGANIFKYQVNADGTLANRTLLIDMRATDKSPGGADGMRVDSKGNVYTTGPGGLWIVSPEGKHLGTINVPAINMTFGGADWKTLYIAARGDVKVPGTSSIYRIRVNTPGMPCHACS